LLAVTPAAIQIFIPEAGCPFSSDFRLMLISGTKNCHLNTINKASKEF
jgi:hypothetical protein